MIRKTLSLMMLLAFFFVPTVSNSQVIKATGNVLEPSSQLIMINREVAPKSIQITNTNETEGTWIHVQIFRSQANGTATEFDVLCDEVDFVDFLTPNDTHTWEFDFGEDDTFNMGENGAQSGNILNILPGGGAPFHHLIIITPVISQTDLTAKSFQHLIGKFYHESSSQVNAMGRDAVDNISGEVLADNIPIDGITNGFILIQPDEVLINLAADTGDGDSEVKFIGISFKDSFGPSGLLGYSAQPSSAKLTSFLFDHKEDPTSCGEFTWECNFIFGINDDFPKQNEGSGFSELVDGRVCDGTNIDPDPGSFGNESGFLKMFVSDIEDFGNVLLYLRTHGNGDSFWSIAKRDGEVQENTIKSPIGNTTTLSSQLIYNYSTTDCGGPGCDTSGNADTTALQITNENAEEGTWVHVQIFRSFDPDNPVVQDGDEVICDERDFVDFLTPNDTHVYELTVPNFTKNTGESAGTAGDATTIDVTGTVGFVVITPVVSESDLTAISFPHLFGTTYLDDVGGDNAYPAIGRDAIDLVTGERLTTGIPLNGVNNGFKIVQPEQLFVNVLENSPDMTPEQEVELIGIVFGDNYSEAGLLGYSAVPGSADWTSFIYDFKEDPTSCGNREINCYTTIGINETFDQNNFLLSQDDFLCAGTITPIHPAVTNAKVFGWLRIFVNGLDENENLFGIYHNERGALGSGEHLHVIGERVFGATEPEAEDCSVAGDEDGDGFADCLDPDCETDPSCENGDQCADGEDNDGDGNSDCADAGCDGATGPNGETCEAGVELTCDDGQDNDGDTFSDCDDPDCAVATNCIDEQVNSGGGGGCSVATTDNPSILNFLLPMIAVGLFVGVRRRAKN